MKIFGTQRAACACNEFAKLFHEIFKNRYSRKFSVIRYIYHAVYKFALLNCPYLSARLSIMYTQAIIISSPSQVAMITKDINLFHSSDQQLSRRLCEACRNSFHYTSKCWSSRGLPQWCMGDSLCRLPDYPLE